MDVGARHWEYRYEDARGRLTTIVDPMLHETHFAYDEADRLLWQQLPGSDDSARVYFDHDAEGNLTGVKPPGRSFHNFTLTPGALTQAYDPPDVLGLAVDQTSYQYNLDRQLEHLYRPDGLAVDLGYESGTGRLVSVTQPRGTSSLTYVPGPGGNGAGHAQSLSSPDGVGLTFGYDGSLPTSETWGFGGGVTGSVSYAFDENFWPTSQTVQGSTGAASTLTYDFDADGLVTSATINGGPALALQPDSVTSLLANTRIAGVQTRYGYNPYAELTSTATWVGSDTLYAATYERDDLGRITRIVETTDGTTTDRAYTYHDRGWLKGVRDSIGHVALGSYAYDLNGNDTLAVDDRGSRSGHYDAQDRLTALGGATYGYTAAGERTARTVGSATDSTYYDLLGNLTRVKLASGDVLEYRVDGKNRRVARLLNGTLTARWLYGNDLAVVGELDGSGALVKRFVYASSGHVPDLMIVRNPSGPDSTYRIVTDHLGSVRLVVNASTGWVAQHMDYDAWGHVTRDTRAGFTPFGYAGGLYDPATGLVRFGARDYDADAGVWTAKDPLGTPVSRGTYCYCGDNPIDRIDPSGLVDTRALLSAGFGLATNIALFSTGLFFSETGAGVIVAAYGAYGIGANIGNIGNALADRPSGPTGPIQTTSQLGMLAGGVDAGGRTWNVVDMLAQVGDAAVPTLAAGQIDMRGAVKPLGPAGSALGFVERAHVPPEKAYPLLRVAAFANLFLDAMDILRKWPCLFP